MINAKPARQGAFSIGELAITMGLFGILTLMALGVFHASSLLYAKNLSLNISNNAAQTGADKLTNSIEEAVELVGAGTWNGSLFTAAPTGSYGNAVSFMRMLPYTLYVQTASGYSITDPPTSPIKISAGTTQIKASCAKSFQPGAAGMRLMTTYPVSRSGGKLGLPISGTAVTPREGGGSNITITLQERFSDGIYDYNQAFILVESCYAVMNRGRYSELVYIPDLSRPSEVVSVMNAIDPRTQKDLANGNVTGNFKVEADGSLTVFLPVRAADYAQSVARTGKDAEFNGYAKFCFSMRSKQKIQGTKN